MSDGFDFQDSTLPVTGRTRTDEFRTMQVMVLSRWHRRMPSLEETSCEVPYHSQFCPLRREELTGDLCTVCFTPGELDRAAKNNAKKDE